MGQEKNVHAISTARELNRVRAIGIARESGDAAKRSGISLEYLGNTMPVNCGDCGKSTHGERTGGWIT